jgi:hypothetical protein
MGIGFISRDLSLMEPPDLVGMPKLDGAATRYLPPAFLPTEGQGLINFEELNRCASYMQAPCLQLLTARRLNDYCLPAGWLPAACINPAADGYNAEELDLALVSRFVVVKVEPDPEEWLAWAERRRVHPNVMGYVGSDARIFHNTNPRAWAMVDRIVRASEAVQPDKTTLEAAVAGAVGIERAAAFRRFRRQDVKPPTALELLNAYRTWGKQVRAWVRARKTDVLGNLTYSVLMLLQPREGYERVHDNAKLWKALGDFLNDLPANLAEQVRADLRERGRDIPPAGNGQRNGKRRRA